MATKYKNLNYGKKFKWNADTDEYTFQLRKRRSWWWLLLLLLPLLLLIRCERDMTVTVVETESREPVQGAQVTLAHTSHYLADMWHFLPDYPHEYTLATDDEGRAEFKDMPCSVFSYIFYCLQRADVTVTTPCHEAKHVQPNFHYTRNVTVELDIARADALVTVYDLETGDPLPGAKVWAAGAAMPDTLVADAVGRVWLRQLPVCATLDTIYARSYGYADTLAVNIPVRDCVDTDSAALRLRPIKEKFTFFVKDVETREPIPGARAVVSLLDPRSGIKGEHSVTTNVDGRGMGFYDSGFVLSTVHIAASKPHYNDSTLAGEYTVAEFIRQPDDHRTVWLRPLPFTVDYQVVDSVTRQPIPGADVTIKVTDPTGEVKEYNEITNRNGRFPVNGKPGSRVEIDVKAKDYHGKHTEVPSHDDEARTIELDPVITPLDVDMVLVIDDTGSMDKFIGMVKTHAKSFYSDLDRVCRRNRLRIHSMRLKVVSFGDLGEHALRISPLFNLPEQSGAYQSFVSGITAHGGGDTPEDGLQALQAAFNTPWSKGVAEKRNVVIVFTDAPTHAMTGAWMADLHARWIAIPAATRRMILFAPGEESWSTISRTWPDVHHERGVLSTVLSGAGYNTVLDYICKSL